MISNFELMASYNQWMNKSVYENATKLSNGELEKNRGAFFSSIIGTLNHILVGDIIWLKRFATHDADFPSLEPMRAIAMPVSLDSPLYSTLAMLAEAREQVDEVIVQFSSELTEQVMASPLAYRNVKGEASTKNFGHLIAHFFNHQTHHRGQVSTLLHQAGVNIGMTDLLAVIPDE